jgi:hypothetical protein
MPGKGEMKYSEGKEVQASGQNNPTEWEPRPCHQQARQRCSTAGFYLEGNTGFMEEEDPIAEANSENSPKKIRSPWETQQSKPMVTAMGISHTLAPGRFEIVCDIGCTYRP